MIENHPEPSSSWRGSPIAVMESDRWAAARTAIFHRGMGASQARFLEPSMRLLCLPRSSSGRNVRSVFEFLDAQLDEDPVAFGQVG